MGMSKLSEIVRTFSKEGKSDCPVAIIQNGTTKNEKIGTGTISTIESVVEAQHLSNPAIIVIGEVVGNRQELELAKQQFVLATAI